METHGKVTPDLLRHRPTGDANRSFLTHAAIGLTHLVVGSIGVAAVTACALYATQEAVHPFLPSFDRSRAAWLLLTIPGYPLQALNGVVLGFLLAKRLGGWISKFTWLLPLGQAVLVWLNEPERSVVFQHLKYDGTCPPGGACFMKAMATLMVVSSISYSLGAIVGVKKRCR